jgi:NAD(P)-dependent dehydrogenase (short-subunit alcohol dehydrogenase family)
MTSSSGSVFGMQGNVAYAIAKGGVSALTRALALEGGEYGIRVNAVLPGAATAMGRGNLPPGYDRHFRVELRDALAPRREASGVAGIVLYLASDACEINGEMFSSICGRVARVVVGVTEGWVGDYAAMSPEDVRDHFTQICDPSGSHEPASLWDEYELIGRSLGL